MGLKSDSHTSRYPKDSTRGAKGKQDVITKQLIETTRCTIAEAEEALAECNFDIELAVNYIFDRNGDNVWTETKNRKTKKSEEEVRPVRGTRGRGGRGRGTSSANRGEYNSENVRSGSEREHTSGERYERGRGRGGRGRGGSRVQNREDHNAAEKPVEKTTDENVPETEVDKVSAPTTNGFHGKTSFADKVSGGRKTFENPNYQKKDGQYEAKRPMTESSTVEKPVASAATVPAPVPAAPTVLPNKAGPLSYAALLASGSKKPQPPVAPTVSKPVTPAATSTNNAQVSSASAVKEPTPVPETPKAVPSVSEETQASSVSEPKPVETTPQSLTSQLKNDLGLTMATGATKNPQLISSPATSSTDKSRIPIEYAGVEGAEGSGYQFGPATGSPMTKQDEVSFASSNNSTSTAHDFSRSHDADMYKSNEPVSLPKAAPISTSQPASVAQQMSNQHVPPVQQTMQANIAPRRNLGYAETNSVTINPLENRQSNVREIPPSTAPQVQAYNNKPTVTAQSSLSHQHPMNLHHQGQQQQQLYNPMFNSFPYMNLYSPVAGREDQNLYANPYMSYAAYGMDMNSIAQVIPQLPMQTQLGHQPQNAHRNEHMQSFNDKVQNYGQANPAAPSNVNPAGQRENTANVPPPPGFSGPPASLAHHNMFPQNMFSYPVQMSPFVQKMPGQMNYQAGNDEVDVRHQPNKMYGGQSDKYTNGRDRMNMGNAQPTPPPQAGYGQAYGGNPQMNSVLNKKPFHGQWTN